MFIVGLVFLFLSLPAIVSYLQFLPLTERGSGATYEEAMSNPLHPILTFSFLTPLPVWKAPFVAVTDPLERNCYFGLIAFAFLISGFLLKSKNSWLKFCKWAFIVTLIFSLGKIGILRPITYYALPLMDSFRHPANAKIFTIFFACIIAAFAMHQMRFTTQKKLLINSLFILSFILMILFVWGAFGSISLFRQNNLGGENNITKLKSILDSSTFSDLLLINIFIQLPFLWIIYLFSKNKTGLKTLVSVGLVNCIIHSMLFMPFTVVKKDRADYIQNLLAKNIVETNSKPDLNVSIERNSVDGYKLFKEIGSLNMYNKKIGRIDYRITPSNLNNQNIFWNENIRLRNIFVKYPILYKADTALLVQDSSKAILANSKFILVKDTNIFSQSFFRLGNYKWDVKNFTPNEWEIVVSSSVPGVYCFFQNFYPNWKLYVDGKEKQIFHCNLSFMGFTLNEGVHNITFRYHSNSIKYAYFISLLVFLIVFILALKAFGNLIHFKSDGDTTP